ncbi:MAG: ATPase P [Chloroflexi bacterium]|nr:ATPase P [Chloroflexota bacterium]
MIKLDIPGRGVVQLAHLVCDVNGTLAVDGHLHEGLAQIFVTLRERLSLHLLTADTHGRQYIIDQQLDLEAVRVTRGNEAAQKAEYVRNLGAEHVAAIGQGANDAAMLQAAAIGIGILSVEGLSGGALRSADIIVPDIYAALGLLENPLRIVATLRT